MVCAACGSEPSNVRLPLDRAHVAVCGRCGHGTTVSATALVDERQYGLAADAKTVFEHDYLPARRRSYERGLDLLGDGTGRTLLDYGCGYGHFLELAQGRGWSACGFEPAAAVRQQIADRDVSVVGTIQDALDVAPFDVVTLWDVLEHLDPPLEHLELLRTLIRPGGVALVRVPDARAFAVLNGGPVRRWWGHLYLKLCHPTNPEEHRHHFTPVSLSALGERAGLRCDRRIEAAADERISAGRGAPDAVLRRALHSRAADIPYEFTMVLARAESELPVS